MSGDVGTTAARSERVLPRQYPAIVSPVGSRHLPQQAPRGPPGPELHFRRGRLIWVSASACRHLRPTYSNLALSIDRTVTREKGHVSGPQVQFRRGFKPCTAAPGHLGKLYMVKVDPSDLEAVLVPRRGEPEVDFRSMPEPELSSGVSLLQWHETVALARKRTAERARVPLER